VGDRDSRNDREAIVVPIAPSRTKCTTCFDRVRGALLVGPSLKMRRRNHDLLPLTLEVKNEFNKRRLHWPSP